MFSGVEYCPYCEGDFEYSVPDDAWTTNCPHCGKEVALCNKCYTMNDNKYIYDCGDCPYEKHKKGN